MSPKTDQTRKAVRKDDPAQSRAFIEKARELEADEEASGADELLGHLHHKPPEPHKPGKGKAKPSR